MLKQTSARPSKSTLGHRGAPKEFRPKPLQCPQFPSIHKLNTCKIAKNLNFQYFSHVSYKNLCLPLQTNTVYLIGRLEQAKEVLPKVDSNAPQSIHRLIHMKNYKRKIINFKYFYHMSLRNLRATLQHAIYLIGRQWNDQEVSPKTHSSAHTLHQSIG